MKSTMPPAIIHVIALSLVAALVPGCKVDNLDLFVPAEPSALVSIQVSPSMPSMAPGTTLQLEAVGRFSNNTTRNLKEGVVWSSENPKLATVNESGLAASAVCSSGTTTITASAGSLTGSAVLTVSCLASITVRPAGATIAPGTTRQFSAVGTLQNSATQDLSGQVAWNSSSSVAAVSESGLVSAHQAATGQTTITAEFASKKGATVLTTTDVASITVLPASATVMTGEKQQFSATGFFPNNASQDLTRFASWSAASTGIAVIDGSGAAVSITPGLAVITASFGSASGSGVLKVVEPGLASISIIPVSQSIAAGTSQQFAATGIFRDGSKRDMTAEAAWISSNTAVASVSSLPGTKGLVTASATGTTLISASFTGILSNQATLTVAPAAAAPSGAVLILIDPSNPSVRIGSSLQLTALAVSSDGSIREDLTASAAWTSSNSSIVFVSQGFAVSLGTGSARITATAGNLSGSTLLTVTSF